MPQLLLPFETRNCVSTDESIRGVLSV